MNSMVDFINNYRYSHPTGWRKWVVGFFVLIAVVLVVAGYAITATIRGRQIATLQVQRDLAEQAAHRATVDASLAEHETARLAAVRAAEVHGAEVTRLQQQIDVLQATHEDNASFIDSIKSWNDFDTRVK